MKMVNNFISSSISWERESIEAAVSLKCHVWK
jgi:hypothetical protein